MTKRIGILTGGGDCPGLNAAIRAVFKHARHTYGWDVVGIEDGFAGMIDGRTVELSPDNVANLLARGGTILGSSNRANPFAFRGPDDEVRDVSKECLANMASWGLSGLVVVGGDGTMGIGKKLMDVSEGALPMVGIPKTIDNDLEATEYTIGFQTAVDVATDAIDRLHTTAESHDRIIVCEVMGRYAGWIAMAAGLAGGADVILVPEFDYDIDRVVGSLQKRHKSGRSYSIVVVAEGAKPVGGDYAVAVGGDATREQRLGGAGQRVAEAIADKTAFDVRVTVLGHIQRGGTPCAFDRNLATQFGVAAVDYIATEQFGVVASLRGGKIVASPIGGAVAKLKRVTADSALVQAARGTGVELGAP